MTLHVAVEPDPIAALVRFRTSSVFQMLVSLQSVTHPWRHREWTERVRAALGGGFVAEIKGLYERFHNGCDFSETAIDYGDEHDVPGFIDHVGALSPRLFAFYVLGRVYPPEELPEQPTAERIYALVEKHGNLEHFQHAGMSFEWADDVKGLQAKLTHLWRTYWTEFYHGVVSEHARNWENSIQEKEQLLNQKGGKALLEALGTCGELPPPIPADQPFTRVEVIPACMMPRTHHMFYGYGSVTLVYDCTRSAQANVEVERSKADTLTVLKALADENRLRILKLISGEELAYNGQRIAKYLGLSASVVSRHLAQLKEAGLISEHSPDNRNILYRAQREKLLQMQQTLLHYLND
jgi:DNA-binding transcriptional ArsR family regulator